MVRVIGVMFALLAAAGAAGEEAVSSAQSQTRGDYLTLRIAVIGPGTEVFAWWGHTGVIVQNDLTGEEKLYDYGIFSFAEEHFLRNFITGNFFYRMMARNAKHDIAWYIADNRDIILYTLNLDARQKEEMVDFLEWNALPENNRYYYKLFTDNCVTRVVLLLDKTLNGQFIEYFNTKQGSLTVRAHSNRHMYFSPVVYWLLNFIMGQDLDKPPAALAEMFLPSEFGANIAGFSYRNAVGEDVPLVSAVEVVHNAAGRHAVLDGPPDAFTPSLVTGMALACMFGFCIYFYRVKQKRSARMCLGLLQSIYGLVFGIPGTLLFYVTFFSNHIYTHNNINVLFANPLLLLTVPLGCIFAFSKKQRTVFCCRIALQTLWSVLFMAALLSIALRLSPRFFQDNSLALAVFMPPACMLSAAGARAFDVVKKRSRGSERAAPPYKK